MKASERIAEITERIVALNAELKALDTERRALRVAAAKEGLRKGTQVWLTANNYPVPYGTPCKVVAVGRLNATVDFGMPLKAAGGRKAYRTWRVPVLRLSRTEPPTATTDANRRFVKLLADV